MANFLLVNGLQGTVAVQTALEGLNGAEQVKPAQHLDHLLTGIGGPQAVTVGNDVALEQAAITRQQDSVFLAGDAGQFFVGVIVSVEGVETQHPQING